ncbi:hypothetical protein [uncultured Jannaschia sp.]|uniref:hypothetical protein n=1 Tax=uncultured Jannaschia sp. TaxID=293347 RepID=UPI00261D6D7D|nr:hypothetical protein [uncultured Jannaschia sp.]
MPLTEDPLRLRIEISCPAYVAGALDTHGASFGATGANSARVRLTPVVDGPVIATFAARLYGDAGAVRVGPALAWSDHPVLRYTD